MNSAHCARSRCGALASARNYLAVTSLALYVISVTGEKTEGVTFNADGTGS